MTKLQSITFHTYSLLKCGRWGGKLLLAAKAAGLFSLATPSPLPSGAWQPKRYCTMREMGWQLECVNSWELRKSLFVRMLAVVPFENKPPPVQLRHLLKCIWDGNLGWQAGVASSVCHKGRRSFLSGDSVATAKRSLAAQTVLQIWVTLFRGHTQNSYTALPAIYLDIVSIHFRF